MAFAPLLSFFRKRNSDRGYQPRLWLPCLIGSGLAVFISYILTVNHYANSRARQDEITRIEFRTGEIAGLVENHLEWIWQNQLYLVEDRSVVAYWENKALGMSMEYGLRASLASMTVRFVQQAEEHRLQRIALLTGEGQLLVDTHPEKGRLTNSRLTSLGPLHGGKERIVYDICGQPEVVMINPVWYKNTYQGILLTWIDPSAITELLPGPETMEGIYSFVLKDNNELVCTPKLSSGEVMDAQPAQDRLAQELRASSVNSDKYTLFKCRLNSEKAHIYMAMEKNLLNWPLKVHIQRPASKLVTSLHSWFTLIGLASLAVIMTGGLFIIFQSQSRALVLSNTTRHILGSIPSVLISLDDNDIITNWNHVAESCLGLSVDDALGRKLGDLSISWDRDAVNNGIRSCRDGDASVALAEIQYQSRDNQTGFLTMNITPIKRWQQDHNAVLLVATDITRQKHLQMQLGQAQRLESIGRLASGIAHEINTPTQFVKDNTHFLRIAFSKVSDLLNRFQDLLVRLRREGAFPEWTEANETELKKAKLEYLLAQIPRSIEDSLEGLQRISHIVLAMNNFAHDGRPGMAAADLNQAIENTVTIARNEWKSIADVTMKLDPDLPLIVCNLVDINQAILNIIMNAIDAIADAVEKGIRRHGQIMIATRVGEGYVEISIADNGGGIPEHYQSKIFDPFFTTKDVGKGSGQGLAFAHSIIKERHNGAIHFETSVGEGTTFIIRLPLVQHEMETVENTDETPAYR